MSSGKCIKLQTFPFPTEKDVAKIDKDSNQSVVTVSQNKIYRQYKIYGKLRYQILLIILQKKFIKLNVKIVIAFFEQESVQDSLIIYKCLSCNKDQSKKLKNNLKRDSRTSFSFVMMIPIYLFRCQGKVFLHIIKQMTEKSLMKQHYLKKNKFIAI